MPDSVGVGAGIDNWLRTTAKWVNREPQEAIAYLAAIIIPLTVIVAYLSHRLLLEHKQEERQVSKKRKMMRKAKRDEKLGSRKKKN